MLFDLWYDFLKACSPLEGYIRYLILSLLDTRTNIRTYRAAIAAKNLSEKIFIPLSIMVSPLTNVVLRPDSISSET